MVSLNLGEFTVGRNGHNVYFIAELGQNHQGDLGLAKNMIIKAKECGCNCVKFQKSCLKFKFSESALCRKYDGINSWGNTYGEHKEYLEFSIFQYKELQDFCSKIAIDFTASAMDEISLGQLDELNVPFIKVGSGDANNFPLLENASQLKRPLVISTGMQTEGTIERIVDIMRKANKSNYALMHCVSSYPTDPKDCQLDRICRLRQKYPNLVIGYSGHELGIDISKAAVLLGARIIERHFTLDRTQKGSDHQCSLEPSEMSQLVASTKFLISHVNAERDFANLDVMTVFGGSSIISSAIKLCDRGRYIMSCEMKCRDKLGKSLVAAKSLAAGHTIRASDLWVKVSEPKGISAENIDTVIGSQLIAEVEIDMPILREYLIGSK